MNRLVLPIKSPNNPLFPPACNTLVVDSIHGLPPSWRWSAGITTVVSPAQPAVPAVPAVAPVGNLGDDNYVAKQDAIPEVPAVAEVTQYSELRSGNDAMTQSEWDAWTSQDDEYLASIAAARQGLELA